MQIVYDDTKRRSNLAKHRLDFADLDAAFFATALFASARQGRLKAVGWFQERLVVAVIFKPLGSEALSVISMRPAKRTEREAR
jgi:uncharacterized protein